MPFCFRKGKSMSLDYFYGKEAEQFAFYRVPKILFTDERYARLSADAKLLYGLMIDRMGLSRQNGWIDDQDRVYIRYTNKRICIDMGCASKKACKLLDELEKRAGLIERKRTGGGKANVIYLKNFVDDFSALSKAQFKDSQKENSGDVKSTIHELSKAQPNNTNNNNNDLSNINPILSGDENGLDEYSAYREYFYQQLEIDVIKLDYPYQVELIDSIVELIVEVMCSTRKKIRIASDDKPINIVKSRFMKLTAEHIKFVLDRFGETTTKISNTKQYMLATIFNAPTTIDGYYDNLVRHDMTEGRV